MSNPLPFCLDHRHLISKTLDVDGKLTPTLFRKQAGYRTPTAFDRIACLDAFMFAGFDNGAAP